MYWVILIVSGVVLSRLLQVCSEWLLGLHFRGLKKRYGKKALVGGLDSGREISSYGWSWRWLTLRSYDVKGKFLVIVSDIAMVLGVYHVSTYWLVGDWLSVVAAIVFVVALGLSFGTDFRERYILNVYTYPALVIVGLIKLFAGDYVWWVYVVGAVVVFVLLWLSILIVYPFKRKQGFDLFSLMGMGDMKLFVLVGLYMGVFGIPFVLLVSAVLGLVFGIILYVKRNASHHFAFGPFIVFGALIVLILNLDMIM